MYKTLTKYVSWHPFQIEYEDNYYYVVYGWSTVTTTQYLLLAYAQMYLYAIWYVCLRRYKYLVSKF